MRLLVRSTAVAAFVLALAPPVAVQTAAAPAFGSRTAAASALAAQAAGARVPHCHGEPASRRAGGTNGPDQLQGTPRRDVIVGLRGDDVIRGGAGDDLVCGGRVRRHALRRTGLEELRG
ncbi:MAG: hypothetical protein M3419_07595 [Actinomycetota bacterium]|nr:hypothetical protein [Actinomycetota bacterium]